MSARIMDRTWTCDCCGLENDQRGCVKGPPTCDCYHTAMRLGGFSLGPNFCATCGRCQLHCPGSITYEAPSNHPFARYRRDSGFPISRGTKPHPFRSHGFCHCENIAESDLVKEREEVPPSEFDANPGHVNKVIHTPCGKWYLPDAATFNVPAR